MKTKNTASKGSVGEATLRLGRALGRRAIAEVGDKVGSVTDNVMTFRHKSDSQTDRNHEDVTEDRTEQSSLTEAAQATTIVETVDVGVPVDVAYDQWTRFTEFPSFMRTIEDVEQTDDDELTWRARVLWSRRTWKSTIVEQTPDEQIVWRSTGRKGYADGAVTFHALAPGLTRIVLVLEYHPKGLIEHLGNLGRTQSRRARQDLKRFQRHVMTRTALHTDDLHGWRGEIHDGEVIAPEDTEDTEDETEAGKSQQGQRR